MVECVHRGGVVTRIASASHNGKDRQQFVYEVELPPAGKAAVAQKYSNENFMTVKESSASLESRWKDHPVHSRLSQGALQVMQ